jgi:hypothetical protein
MQISIYILLYSSITFLLSVILIGFLSAEEVVQAPLSPSLIHRTPFQHRFQA